MPRAVQHTAQTTFIVACFRSSYHVSVSHVVPVVHRAKSGLIYSLSRISPPPSLAPLTACWDEVEGYPPISLIQTRGIPPSSGALTESGNRPGANLSIPNNSTPVCPTARKQTVAHCMQERARVRTQSPIIHDDTLQNENRTFDGLVFRAEGHQQ